MVLQQYILRFTRLIPVLILLVSCNRLPEPEFSWGPEDNPEAGAVIWFENKTPEASFYEWHFGDGIRSDLENPTHIFDEPGNYDVELSAYNDAGSQMKSRTVTINDPTILSFQIVDSSETILLTGAELWVFDNEADWEMFSEPMLIGYANSSGEVAFHNLESMVYYIWASKVEADGIWIAGGSIPALTLNENNAFYIICEWHSYVEKKTSLQFATPAGLLRRIN